MKKRRNIKYKMADYLIRKQTGYMTCCPDEENTVGYYKFKDSESVEVYTEPSYDSETYNKVLDRKHELWKFNHSDILKLSSQEMDKKFGNIYTLEDIDFRIAHLLDYGVGKKYIIKKKKLHGLEFMKMKICGFLLNTISMIVQKKKVRTKKKKQQIHKKIKLNVGVVYTMNLIKWLMNVVDIKLGDVT